MLHAQLPVLTSDRPGGAQKNLATLSRASGGRRGLALLGTDVEGVSGAVDDDRRAFGDLGRKKGAWHHFLVSHAAHLEGKSRWGK